MSDESRDSSPIASGRTSRQVCEEAEAAYSQFEAEVEAAAAAALARRRKTGPFELPPDDQTTDRGRLAGAVSSAQAEWSDSDEEQEDPSAATYSEACKAENTFPCRRWLAACADRSPSCDLKHYGLGPRGVIPLATSLSINAHICELDLSDNRLGGPGIGAVLQAIRSGGPQRLQRLDLSGNQAGTDGTEALANFLLCSADKQPGPKLSVLAFESNGITDKGAAKLAPSLGALPGIGFMVGNGKPGPCLGSFLKALSLARNDIAESGRAICAALEGNATLEAVDLSWNQITDGAAVAKIIRENRKLRQLNVSWNGLGDAGIVAMTTALSQAPEDERLTSLAVARNRVSAKGALALALLVGKLDVLDISGNPIGAEGAKPILAAYQEAMAASPSCRLVANDICVRDGTPVAKMLELVAEGKPLESPNDDKADLEPLAEQLVEVSLEDKNRGYQPKKPGNKTAITRSSGNLSFPGIIGGVQENGDDAFEIRPRRNKR